MIYKKVIISFIFLHLFVTGFSQCPSYTAPTGGYNGSLSDCITQVVISGLGTATMTQTSASPCGNPSNNSMAGTTTLYTGTTVSICINVGTGTGTHYAGLWIDWNGNGSYADAGEFFDFSGTIAASATNVCVSVPVPVTAISGQVGMRIKYAYNNDVTSGEYLNDGSTYGEWENYCLTVLTCNNCSNGIMDCGETGIDCGGPNCTPCPGTCFDGVQNQTETGIDCGGPCISCTPQANITSTTNCTGAAQANIYPVTCEQIGTSAYDLSGPNATFASGAATNATPTPTCSYSGADDCWIHVNLEPGVSQFQMQFEGGSMASGSSTCYVAAYQGTCGSLSYIGCQKAEEFISSQYGVYNVLFTGLDHTQDLWLYMYNDNNKAFNLTFNMVGSGTPPANTSCAAPSAALGNACNLGASGASFTTPGAAAVACTGGSWGSNENTTFYSFTPTATSATLNITDIVCNDGTTGQAQFGVWTSCAAIGTYGGSFLGCAVGTSNLNLSGLTIGQTYYIAADGYAGDNCTWAFSGSGIVLPVELTKLTAKLSDSRVMLQWETATEKNNDFFTVERSKDAENFEFVSTVKGAGTTNQVTKYAEYDHDPYKGISYYRLKQTDYDGKYVYSRTISVDNRTNAFTVIPNPSASESGFGLQTAGTDEKITVVISDLSGKIVFNQDFVNESGNIDVKHNLCSGIYLIKIITDQNIDSQKLIIK